MDSEDVLKHLLPYLDDLRVEDLHLSISIPSLSKLSNDQTLWHERVQTLMQRYITFSPESDWKETYYILKRQLTGEPLTTLWNIEDNTQAVLCLINMGFNPALHPSSVADAANHGSTKILKLLLIDGRIDPGERIHGLTNPLMLPFTNPLILAVYQGHEEAVRLLLADPRVDPSVDGNFPLWIAVSRHHTDIAHLLVAHPRMILDPLDPVNIRLLLSGGRRDRDEAYSYSVTNQPSVSCAVESSS